MRFGTMSAQSIHDAKSALGPLLAAHATKACQHRRVLDSQVGDLFQNRDPKREKVQKWHDPWHKERLFFGLDIVFWVISAVIALVVLIVRSFT